MVHFVAKAKVSKMAVSWVMYVSLVFAIEELLSSSEEKELSFVMTMIAIQLLLLHN